MYSKPSKALRATAAWRISIWTTVAFALGTALANSIVYVVVARAMQEHSDAWLSGEADVLSRVSADTPRDRLYSRVVAEVAELAERELPDERNALGQKLNSVFFLETNKRNDNGEAEPPIWVGSGAVEPFREAIDRTSFMQGIPQSIVIAGWPTSFRVVAHRENGRSIYLGLSNRGTEHLLGKLTRRLLLLWCATVCMGFAIAYWSAHRTLRRVQNITDTVARMGSEDLAKRLPEPINSDEISQLAQTFNRMLDRIQSSVKELRSVTDTVAHDLRSPLTSIRGTLESALSGEGDGPTGEAICDAIEGLDRTLLLLNTTLDVAEAQAGALRMERHLVDLSALIRQLVELYRPAMDQQRHQVETELEDGVIVDADGGLLNRVITNLLENELAHVPAEAKIGIRLQSQNNMAVLTVDDNGPGFSPEISDRALERFVRGKYSKGHGLGLAFVDAVVRAHGGSVEIRNASAMGAVITICLPCKLVAVPSR